MKLSLAKAKRAYLDEARCKPKQKKEKKKTIGKRFNKSLQPKRKNEKRKTLRSWKKRSHGKCENIKKAPETARRRKGMQ